MSVPTSVHLFLAGAYFGQCILAHNYVIIPLCGSGFVTSLFLRPQRGYAGRRIGVCEVIDTTVHGDG